MLSILARIKRPSYLQDMNLALALSLLVLACLYADFSNAEVSDVAKQAAISQEAAKKVNPLADRINKLEKPMFTPFIELYVLEEMKQLRIDFANQKRELMQEVMDREHSAIDRAINYSSNTVTYFFYLIAGASSVMLLVGWNSLREIKDRVHTLADEEISKLVSVYEDRLHAIEKQLNQKTQHIEENREEIELTQGIQSLWLRAAQDTNATSKIEIYDEILKLRQDDCEALTYKADAVLELDEPQWAASLCHQALKIDPENSHAFYQLACAYTALRHYDDALKYLSEALSRKESYRDDILCDDALEPLVNDPIFEDFSDQWGVKVS
jgi:tetratricopeptide (TPR) repeat protein